MFGKKLESKQKLKTERGSRARSTFSAVHIEKAAAKGVSLGPSLMQMSPWKRPRQILKINFSVTWKRRSRLALLSLYKSQPYTIVDDPVGWKGGTFGRLIFRATRY